MKKEMEALVIAASWTQVYLIDLIFHMETKLESLRKSRPSQVEFTALWNWSDDGALKEILSLILDEDPFDKDTQESILNIVRLVLGSGETQIPLDKTEDVM